jgi:hypothetical protein
MSVSGEEEDGVDDPKEAQGREASDGSTAPKLQPGEGTGTMSGAGSSTTVSDGASDAAESAAASTDSQPAPRDEGRSGQGAHFSVAPNSSVTTQEGLADRQRVAAAVAAPLSASGAEPRGVFDPPAPGSPTAAIPLPGMVGAASDAAKGLAAKVSASFSGLSKPKVAKRTRPARNPTPTRIRTVPQGVRPQARLSPTGQQAGVQHRRAQLRIDRVEPWSVMKFSFLLSLIFCVILIVAVSILYVTLSGLGVFTSIEHTWGLVTSTKSNPAGSNAASWFSASRVIGYTILIGAVNVILMTALATIGAVLYNLVTMITGGVEVTLKESD